MEFMKSSYATTVTQKSIKKKQRVDDIVERLYRTPTENFLYKTVQHASPQHRGPFVSPNYFKDVPHKKMMKTLEGEEFCASKFLASTFQLSEDDTKAQYKELMASFKSDPREANAMEEVPTIKPTAFKESIIKHKKAERRKAAHLFKNEEKAMKEVMRSFSAERKQIMPAEVSLTSSFASPRILSPQRFSSKVANVKPISLFTVKPIVTIPLAKKQAKKMNIAERTAKWQSAKVEKLVKGRTHNTQKELCECTFNPSRITKKSRLASEYETKVSKKTNELIKEFYYKHNV